MNIRRKTIFAEVLEFEVESQVFSIKSNFILVVLCIIASLVGLGALILRLVPDRILFQFLLFYDSDSDLYAKLLLAILIILCFVLYALFQRLLTKKITIDSQWFSYGRRKISLSSWQDVLYKEEITIMRGEYLRLPTPQRRDLLLKKSSRIDNFEALVWALEQALGAPLYLNFTGNIAEYSSSNYKINVITDVGEVYKYQAKKSMKGTFLIFTIVAALLIYFLSNKNADDSLFSLIFIGIVLLVTLLVLRQEISIFLRPNRHVLRLLSEKESFKSDTMLYSLNQDYSTATFYKGLAVGSLYIFSDEYIFQLSEVVKASLFGYISRKSSRGLYVVTEFENREGKVLTYTINCRHLKDYYRMVKLLETLDQKYPHIIVENDEELQVVVEDYFQRNH